MSVRKEVPPKVLLWVRIRMILFNHSTFFTIIFLTIDKTLAAFNKNDKVVSFKQNNVSIVGN